MKGAFGWLLCALVLALAAAVWAQTPPALTAILDQREVGLGEPFALTLDVSAEGGSPDTTDPRLPVPQGVSVLGAPSVSTSVQIGINNGRFSRTSGLKIVWQLVASREGTYALGPPSVAWNGRRLSSSPPTITVRAQGAVRRGQPPLSGVGPGPFDPFGMFPPGIFAQPAPARPHAVPTDDPEIQLERPLDGIVFLRALPSAKSAVVGQQITLTVYLYIRPDLAMSSVQVTDPHEPSTPDFYRKDLLSSNATSDARTVMIDGVAWEVRVVYRSALFPLHAGDLVIGAMRETFVGRGLGGRSGLTREAVPLTIRVTEPPVAGRPAGYQIGDVGTFTLTASVDPRATEVGSAIGVTATVKGAGNLPAQLRVPMQSSLEWLDPQVRENVEVQDGKVKGSRTFTYVVRPKAPGTIDLGTLALPYWDPERRGYEIAKAVLGKITVASVKGAPAVEPPSPEQEPLRAVGALRKALGRAPAAKKPLTDRPVYWALLIGAPLAVVSAQRLARAWRALLARWRAERESHSRKVERALREARDARRRGDAQVCAAALDRAIYTAIESATLLKARSVLLGELVAELTGRGIASELAGQIRDVLAALDDVRFTPGRAEMLADLVDRTARILRALSKKKKGPRGAAVVLLLVLLSPRGARADAPEAVFQEAVQAMDKGDPGQAVDLFESLADQGFVHPDASYDRALAYLGRIQAGAERPGDLGRAAAGFEETLLLRPDDRDADVALDAVRAEVARRRARGGAGADVASRPTIDRALIGLASETMWAVLALCAAALFTLGLALRALGRVGGPIHLAATIASPIGGVLLIVLGGLSFGARHLRRTTDDAVVVVPEAHLLSDRGIPLFGGPVPEAARVEISDRKGGLVRIRWGPKGGWVPGAAVRVLVRSP